MFLGLRHRAVGSRHDQDRTVHLGGTGDHVLDEVGVAGAVDVSVVTIFGLILDVSHRDGHRLGRVTNGTTLGDIRITLGLCQSLGGLNRQDRTGGGCFAVVNVANGPDVHVGLGTIKSFLSHF